MGTCLVIYTIGFLKIYMGMPLVVMYPAEEIFTKMRRFWRPPFWDCVNSAFDLIYFSRMMDKLQKIWIPFHAVWIMRGIGLGCYVKDVTVASVAVFIYYFQVSTYYCESDKKLSFKTDSFFLKAHHRYRIMVLRVWLSYILQDGPASIIQWFYHEKVRSARF